MEGGKSDEAQAEDDRHGGHRLLRRDGQNVHIYMKSVADYKMKKEKVCKNTLGCLMCKAFTDTHKNTDIIFSYNS